MKRPTISLAMIVKNEADNLVRLFKSIEGCFDEIHITDTGSTDDTVEIAKSLGAQVHHFKWVDDFSAARNASFEPVKTDYVMWLDADDVLDNREAFIKFRDDAMGLADYWLATYDYAHDVNGKPVVSFARERVLKVSKGMKWNYFVHEGIPPVTDKGQIVTNFITTWKVIHKRTLEDITKDKSRNLNIFMRHKDNLDARMTYYFGKELFEAQRPMEAFKYLMEAIVCTELSPHDRLLGIQYACLASMACTQFQQAIPLAHQGLQLDPSRAEFYCIIGDCSLKLGKLKEAIPAYSAAKNCVGVMMPGDKYAGAIFAFPDHYTFYPRNQIARILYSLGDFSGARKEAQECFDLYGHPETKGILEELQKAITSTTIPVKSEKVDEIVITTPPLGAYPWDEGLAQVKGMGGSETAAIEMAKYLRKLTGLPVKVFNPRDQDYFSESGVQYVSVSKLNEYFSKYEPRVHIAWRHNHKLTNAPTYLWCHDLITPSCEVIQNFDKILCLSPFHKRYVQAMQGLKDNQVMVTRNGIDPEKFQKRKLVAKNPNKIIFPSSPDRGLDRCMKILDEVVKEFPDLELHVFYGFENLYKAGGQMAELADRIKAMVIERPYVKFHGFTQQNELARHMMESVVWLHPANFIETFCITALEALCSGTYPLTRKLGALTDTLRKAEQDGMATLLDIDCSTPEEYAVWIEETKKVLREKSWNKVDVDPSQFSWESVAKEWIEFMGLPNPNRTEYQHLVDEEIPLKKVTEHVIEVSP